MLVTGRELNSEFLNANLKNQIKVMKNANIVKTAKKTARKSERVFHELLTVDVISFLRYFGEYENEKMEHLRELHSNAFVCDQMAGVAAYDAESKLLVGGKTWSMWGKKQISELIECIDDTINYAKGIKWGKDKDGDDKAIKLPEHERFFLERWTDFMSECPQYDDLIKAFFLCSIVYKPLSEKGKFDSYTTAAFAEMWNGVNLLLGNIRLAQSKSTGL